MRTDVEVRGEKKRRSPNGHFIRREGRQDMGTGVRREDTLYAEDSTKVIV